MRLLVGPAADVDEHAGLELLRPLQRRQDVSRVDLSPGERLVEDDRVQAVKVLVGTQSFTNKFLSGRGENLRRRTVEIIATMSGEVNVAINLKMEAKNVNNI